MTALGPLRKYRFKVFAGPALKAVECVCELTIPFLVRAIIDEGLTPGGAHEGDNGFVLWLCLAVFGLSLLGFAFTMLAQFLAADVATKYAFDLKKELFAHIGKLSPIQLDDYGKNKALNLVNTSCFSLQNGVQMFMRLLIRAPFLVLGSIVASFVMNVYAGFFVLGGLLLSSAVIAFVIAKTPKEYSSLVNELDAISRQGDDLIVGARVVRAFNKQEDASNEFKTESERYRKQALRLARINAFINPLTFGFINLAIVFIIYLGSFALPTTGLSVGSIVAIVSFLTQSLGAIIMFSRLVTSFSRALADKKRVDDFFAILPSVTDGDLEVEPEVAAGEPLFELRGASLSYGGESLALERIDLTIPKGGSVGILGGTGSGKSSMIALLERFIDPCEGAVFFRGHDIRESRLENVRSEIALVSQKPQIFKGTVRDNLTLGRAYSDEQIDEALRLALADDFVYGKEGGLNATVEEGGTNFSGGQKQRLLIARALLSARPMLVLDDATSALDYRSDLLVRKNIRKRKDVTLVLVSQRATSIKDCDVIYVFDKGRIVGKGTHETLLKDCDVYRETYEAQVSQR